MGILSSLVRILFAGIAWGFWGFYFQDMWIKFLTSENNYNVWTYSLGTITVLVVGYMVGTIVTYGLKMNGKNGGDRS